MTPGWFSWHAWHNGLPLMGTVLVGWTPDEAARLPLFSVGDETLTLTLEVR